MLINEVTSKLGISRKAIRYYEEEGLIHPKRNSNNDYRVYDENDIVILKKIKFLRNLNVPIGEIKDLINHKITLKECLEDRIKKIEKEESNFLKIKEMCINIINNNETFDDFNLEESFIEINRMNKEGFTMKKENFKKKKIVGAIVSSLIFSAFFVFLICMFVYFQVFGGEEQIPWIIFWFLILIFGTPVFGIFYNLVLRIKEILGGEEDEASKY